MLFHNEFPQNRVRDPKRHAEWRTYRSLDETLREGPIIYEVKVNERAPEVDFFIIIQDEAVVCLQVKGGHYRINNRRPAPRNRRGARVRPRPSKTDLGRRRWPSETT